LPWGVAGATIAALAIVLLIVAPWRTETPASRPLVRLDVDLGEDVSLSVGVGGDFSAGIAISPDGTRIAYVSGNPTKVFIRNLDQPSATELAGTEGTREVVFSPDGQWLGIVTSRGLSKISVDGGAVVPIRDLGRLGWRGSRWADDGSLMLGEFPNVVRISPDGKNSETITEIRPGELWVGSPFVLPGGKAMLVAVDHPGRVDRTNIDVVTLADRNRRTLIHGGASPRYVQTSSSVGHLLYISGATLFAVPFDPITLQMIGNAVPIVNDVAAEGMVGTGKFDLSGTGTLIYIKARRTASVPMALQWLAPSGNAEPLPLSAGLYQQLSLSPNGTLVALTVADSVGTDIWVYDIERDVLSRLSNVGSASTPLWTRDGRSVLFSSVGNGILQARADGSSPPQTLIEAKANDFPTSFTPDGKRLAYSDSVGGGQIFTASIEDDGRQLKAGKPEPFLTALFAFRFPMFSPDGRWLAYQSRESGGEEIFVTTFQPAPSGKGGRWQISSGGGTDPVWSPTGDTLFYRDNNRIMAVPYTANGDSFVADKPREWIKELGATMWSLAPDGKRVAILRPVQTVAEAKPEHSIVFVQNFFDELRRRAPLPR
jgi:serine/threonine-protein kinase